MENCLTIVNQDELDPLRPDNCVGEDDDVWRTSERLIYDVQGRPARYIDAEQNIQTFSYDDAGNLVNFQDVNGKTFAYSYDALNRLQSIVGPTGIRLILNYDQLDRVTGICRGRAENILTYNECTSRGDVLASYAYDRLGRLVSQSGLDDARYKRSDVCLCSRSRWNDFRLDGK